MRIFIVASLAYFFLVKLPVLKDEIIDSMTPEIPSFNTESISDSDIVNTLKSQFGDFDFGSLLEEKSNDGINNLDF